MYAKPPAVATGMGGPVALAVLVGPVVEVEAGAVAEVVEDVTFPEGMVVYIFNRSGPPQNSV